MIEGVGLLPVIRRLAKEKTAGTIVLDMHNVESALVRETDEAWTIPLLRSPAALLRRRRWKNACDADRAAAGLAAAVFVCSDSDRDRLGALGIDTGPVAVVPNVVPAWVTGAKPGSRKTNERGSPKAVFVGHLRYKPNRAAVQRLIRAIWPLVRKARPDAGLVVAGRTPRNDLLRTATASPGVSVIADPADLVAVYGGADVAVMPLSEGGGTRLKALEALALGLPVVASAKAVEGLGLTAGRHYLAAESDGDFATAILAVFDDPARATAIAEAGRSLIMASHAQNVVDRAVESALGPLRGQTR